MTIQNDEPQSNKSFLKISSLTTQYAKILAEILRWIEEIIFIVNFINSAKKSISFNY
jgi:hypothetical protein